MYPGKLAVGTSIYKQIVLSRLTYWTRIQSSFIRLERNDFLPRITSKSSSESVEQDPARGVVLQIYPFRFRVALWGWIKSVKPKDTVQRQLSGLESNLDSPFGSQDNSH